MFRKADKSPDSLFVAIRSSLLSSLKKIINEFRLINYQQIIMFLTINSAQILDTEMTDSNSYEKRDDYSFVIQYESFTSVLLNLNHFTKRIKIVLASEERLMGESE
jgi:flagellar assembly factor FliW